MKTNGAPPSSEEGKRSAAAAPDPEVTAKATRRRFTAAYKLLVIEKADACETPGEIGRLLRREGRCTARICRGGGRRRGKGRCGNWARSAARSLRAGSVKRRRCGSSSGRLRVCARNSGRRASASRSREKLRGCWG